MPMPFFWFWNPPSQDIAFEDWLRFRGEIWPLVGLVSAISVVFLLVVYRLWIRTFKIRRPIDPFNLPSRAWWLAWLIWAVPAAGVTGIVYWKLFVSRGFASSVLPLWGGITAGLVCWSISLTAFQIFICIRGITPAKFLYHPRWFWPMRRPKGSTVAGIPSPRSR